jgi:2-oxoglutarate dehydrogenase E2 component (dihydrolipoamide succinyltransferase)
MPQMGESIAEGTITKWLKKVGDRVERDEPLFEISTDKVDAEIPSPAAGTLTDIKFKEGDTVEVNTVVAVLDGGGNGAAHGDSGAAKQAEASAAPPQPQAQQQQQSQPHDAQPVPAQAPATPAASSSSSSQAASQASSAPAPSVMPNEAEVAGRGYDAQRPGAIEQGQGISQAADDGGSQDHQSAAVGEQTVEELRKTKSSPLVRNIAKEHGIDISRLEGTGLSGRVTKNDILSFIESGAGAGGAGAAASASANVPSMQTGPATPTVQTPAAHTPPPVQPAAGDRVEPMTVMRKRIAEHMVLSRRTSAHVTTVYEIDMTRVARLREQHKKAFMERAGTKLTYMPFIFQAVTNAIRKFPIFNAQVSGDQIIYKRDINLGMAVALDWGLIVPVIKRADDLSLSGLARAANDLADRARTKQLKPDDVAGGTFTITNPGVFGGLFGTPIINQPQVAILGVGAIEKRAKVVTNPEGDDYIAIRQMAYFALTFDHRIIDGSDAEKFLAYVKELLEAGQFTP